MATKGNIAEKSYDAEKGILSWKFADGRTRDFDLRSLFKDAYDLVPQIARDAAAHGISQKGGDAYASAGTKAAEANMTPVAWAYRACDAVLKSIEEGEFNRAGAGGGGEPALLVQAISRLTGATMEEAESYVANLDDEQKAAHKKRRDVTVEIAKIQAERAAAKLAKATAGDAPADEPALNIGQLPTQPTA